MASNPPFQIEDQTDEDFFDKLVNDDDDDDNMGANVPRFTEGNDSDDDSAFANLTLGEDSGGKADSYGEKEKDPVDAGSVSANAHTSDNSNDSLGFYNSVIHSNNHGEEGAVSEVGFDSKSMISAIKEVGWNSFYADCNDNGVHEFGSYSHFFNDLGENSTGDFPGKVDENAQTGVLDQKSVCSYGQYYDGGQVYRGSTADNGNEQDLNSSHYLEYMYPGWKYDANSGHWYQVDGYEGSDGDGSGTTDVKAGVSYLQQTVQSAVGTMTAAEVGAMENVANWNQASQVNNGYLEHMVFDPQYPGWYYDTIAQEWRTLESYNASVQSTVQGHDQQNQNGFASTGGHSQLDSFSVYGEYGQGDNYGSQGLGNSEHGNWGESYGNYSSHGLNMWQPGTVAKIGAVSSFAGNQQFDTSFGLNMSMNNHVNQSKSSYNSLQEVQLLNNANKVHTEANGIFGLRSSVPSENITHQYHQTNLKQNEQMHFSNDFYGGQKSVNVAQQPLQSSQQFPYASNTGRSSAGRPSHALVTFGVENS